MRALLLTIVVGAIGCVDSGPGPQPKKIDPGFVPSHLLAAPPADLERLDVNLDGKLLYLGNKIDKPRIAPGSPVRITHYWKVLQPIGGTWRVFGIVRGAPTTADYMNLPPTDMEVAHGPATWRAGEIIEDVQEFTLRADWRSSEATVSVGLIAVGAHELGDRMKAEGPHTVDRAVIARRIEVDLSHAPPPLGTIYIPHTAGPITIDGVTTEAAWLGAPSSPELVTAEGSPEPVGKATAKLAWDEDNLYLAVNVTDSDIYSEYKKHDDPLWKADCVEIFIDADGNRRGYVELQVNPNNATFDSWFPAGRAAKGDEAWDSGIVTAVKVRGTPDQSGDTDQGWDVEVAIPWAAVKGRDPNMAIHTPPRVGERWHLNVVRVDKKTGDTNPAASSWNRISYSDFHGLDRMLTAVFADRTGSIIPTLEAPTPTPGAGSAAAPLVIPAVGGGSAALPAGAANTAAATRIGDPRSAPAGAGSGSGAGSAK